MEKSAQGQGNHDEGANLDYLAGNIKVKSKDDIIAEQGDQITAMEKHLKSKDVKIKYWHGRLLSLQKAAREVLGKPGVIDDLDRLSKEVNRPDNATMFLPEMRGQGDP